MVRAAFALALFSALVFASPLAAASSPSFPTTTLADGREVAAGRVLVGFHQTVSPDQRNRLAPDLNASGVPGAQVLSSLGAHGQVLDVSRGGSLDDVLRTVRADPRVLYAEPDTVVHALDTPNDPQFASRWSLPKIQAPSAWGITHSSSTVTIAILDCGIYEALSTTRGPGHPDINAKVDMRQDFTGSSTHCVGGSRNESHRSSGAASRPLGSW